LSEGEAAVSSRQLEQRWGSCALPVESAPFSVPL